MRVGGKRRGDELADLEQELPAARVAGAVDDSGVVEEQQRLDEQRLHRARKRRSDDHAVERRPKEAKRVGVAGGEIAQPSGDLRELGRDGGGLHERAVAEDQAVLRSARMAKISSATA